MARGQRADTAYLARTRVRSIASTMIDTDLTMRACRWEGLVSPGNQLCVEDKVPRSSPSSHLLQLPFSGEGGLYDSRATERLQAQSDHNGLTN